MLQSKRGGPMIQLTKVELAMVLIGIACFTIRPRNEEVDLHLCKAPDPVGALRPLVPKSMRENTFRGGSMAQKPRVPLNACCSAVGAGNRERAPLTQ